jgi:hypothetical protein
LIPVFNLEFARKPFFDHLTIAIASFSARTKRQSLVLEFGRKKMDVPMSEEEKIHLKAV